jgi:hypothetical protein
MGFFGTYLYDQGEWHDVEPDVRPDGDGPWLLADIHDSDLTTVTYRPAGPGTGVCYLGVTPRTYFELDEASAPTDVQREAAGLATWWAATSGDHGHRPGHDELIAKESALITYLAQDVDPEDDDLDDGDDTDVDALDDADVFIEIKTARLLRTLDLPLPAALAAHDSHEGLDD